MLSQKRSRTSPCCYPSITVRLLESKLFGSNQHDEQAMWTHGWICRWIDYWVSWISWISESECRLMGRIGSGDLQIVCRSRVYRRRRWWRWRRRRKRGICAIWTSPATLENSCDDYYKLIQERNTQRIVIFIYEQLIVNVKVLDKM